MESPVAVEASFYAAFGRLDSQLMGDLWSPSPQVYCVHPGGPLCQGVEAVLASWRQIFESAVPPKIEYRLLHSHQTGQLAVHLVEETIHPSGEHNATSARVIATNVYIAEDDGWRMLGHHASLPMVRGAPGPESEALVH